MTVYIDDARVARQGWAFARMWADDLDELREMAQALGIEPQEERRPPHVEHAHFLVTASKKRRALHLGARPVDNFAFAEHVARTYLPPDRLAARLEVIEAVRRAGRVLSL